MSAMAAAKLTGPVPSQRQWIYKRNWDLAFISLSALLVPVPYLIWLFSRDVLGWQPDSGRQVINLLVFAVVAGPHTYATFSRTLFDGDFRSKYAGLVRSSAVIPLIVVALALSELSLLLTIFFFWASLHTIHQILFVVEGYNEKVREDGASRPGRGRLALADYAVLITAIYPIAAYRIAITQDFTIGPSPLNDIIPSLFEQPWLFYLAISLFGLSLAAFTLKSVRDARRNALHLPKTIFIGASVIALFLVPRLENLDTAFQGVNVWHCTQYLALTWYVNRLRVARGELKETPLLERVSAAGGKRVYYGFNLGLTLGSVLLMGVAFAILHYLVGGKWAQATFALETAYYIGVLSFLWIHYYHDHFLFTKTESLMA
jgi:hypothetical protein